MAMRRVYYLEEIHWEIRTDELDHLITLNDDDDDLENNKGNNNYNNNKGDTIIDPTNRSELTKNNYNERTKAANLRTNNYRRNRDPWIFYPK